MQILLIGFQRSGTTLLRRIIQLHPNIKKMFHEKLVLRRLESHDKLLNIFLESFNIDIKNDNWGEKVPYYHSAKKYNPNKYVQLWFKTFPRNGRVIHIIRHPYDVAFSTIKKYPAKKTITGTLKVYKKMVPQIIDELDGNDRALTIKYEDLLLNPDDIIFNIYKFCGVNPNINFRKKMKKNFKNQKYEKIDPTRAFAYQNKQFEISVDMKNVIDKLNELSGIKYEI